MKEIVNPMLLGDIQATLAHFLEIPTLRNVNLLSQNWHKTVSKFVKQIIDSITSSADIKILFQPSDEPGVHGLNALQIDIRLDENRYPMEVICTFDPLYGERKMRTIGKDTLGKLNLSKVYDKEDVIGFDNLKKKLVIYFMKTFEINDQWADDFFNSIPLPSHLL